MGLSESESDCCDPIKKKTLENINFEHYMSKLNDILILKVLKHFKFPKIKGWQLSSMLRMYFINSSNPTKAKLSFFLDEFIRKENIKSAQNDSRRKQNVRQPSTERKEYPKEKKLKISNQLPEKMKSQQYQMFHLA